MKTAKEFRRAHFVALVKKYGRKEVQARLDCSSTYIGQLEGTAKQSRNIGDDKARQIERLFGLRDGEMDAPPSVRQRTESYLTEESVNLSAGEPSDWRESQLVDWYRRISPANKRKLWAQAQLYCLEDDPDAADPFEEAGIPNLLRKGKQENGISGAARGVPRARHGKGS
jgi:hypothetical protein